MDSKRPLGVAVIVIFLVANAFAVVLQLIGDTSFGSRARTLADVHDWMPAFFILLIVAVLSSAAGLWLGYRWAWRLSMLVVGASLVASLYLYSLGYPPYLRMAIDVVLAFYLNQGAVRDYFGRRGRPRDDELADLT